MHQNAFGDRASPGPAGGSYSAPPDPLAGLKGEGQIDRQKGWNETYQFDTFHFIL